MKFIRTRNKIFEVVNSFVDYHKKRIYEVLPNQLIEQSEVVKEADTIEELCDELVLIEEDYPIILETLDFKEKTYLRNNEYEFLSKLPEKPIIFGAIWTDKGLIYVAKMNDKGELELL